MHNVENGQTYIKNLAVFNTARFLKYVWSFYNIIHERANAQLTQFKGYFMLLVDATKMHHNLRDISRFLWMQPRFHASCGCNQDFTLLVDATKISCFLWMQPRFHASCGCNQDFTLLVDVTKMHLGFNTLNSSLWLSSIIF